MLDEYLNLSSREPLLATTNFSGNPFPRVELANIVQAYALF